MKKINKNLLYTLIFALLFVLFTVSVMVIDVQSVGPEGSSVGWATVNSAFFQTFGENLFWYTLTEIIGVLTILVVLGWGLMFLWQAIRRKGLIRIDRPLWAFVFFIVSVAIAYLFFEIFVVNMRPILTEDGLEASYPSSHTMLVICVMAFTMTNLKTYVKNHTTLAVCNGIMAILIVVTVVGRLLSGVHWFTDIIGAILLSATILAGHTWLMQTVSKKLLHRDFEHKGK